MHVCVCVHRVLFLSNVCSAPAPAQHGHLETLRFLAGKAQTGGEEGGVGTCIGERLGCLMLHLAAEAGREFSQSGVARGSIFVDEVLGAQTREVQS